MGLDEEDTRDKLEPTIRYLQKLGPAHLQQIFKSSLWVLRTDRDMGFKVDFISSCEFLCLKFLQIFASEDVELPRQEVADFLDKFDPHVSVRYLEYLVNERMDVSTTFHERLAEAYLSLSLEGKKQGDSCEFVTADHNQS
jgi:hypothetical protein